MLRAEVQEHRLYLFGGELKIEAVLHDGHELNELDSSSPHHIDGLKKIPKVEPMASHLRCQFHPQLLMNVSLVMDFIGFIDARTGSEAFDDLFNQWVILCDMFLADDLQ
jgi:hypothetical protein